MIIKQSDGMLNLRVPASLCLGAAMVNLVSALLLCLLTGCATAPKPVEPVFFPAPPAEAHLQYLTSFSSAEDIERQNKFLRFLIGPPAARQPIVKPYGLAVAQGKVYVCDTIPGRVRVLDLKNRSYSDFVPGRGCNIQKPVNVAVDESGNLYIADTLRGQVVVCSGNGKYRGVIGEKGASRLTDVAVEGDRVYVVDMNKSKVDVYDRATLKPVGSIPASTNSQERLLKPTNIVLDAKKHLYVSDAGMFRIQEYDADGHYVRTFGKHGNAPGEFARPRGIALDREGRLFVADAATSVVQIFDNEARLLLFFGEDGSGPGRLSLPAAVVVDYDNVEMFRKYMAPDFEVEYLVLVTSQYGDRKINVYGFGRPKK